MPTTDPTVDLSTDRSQHRKDCEETWASQGSIVRVCLRHNRGNKPSAFTTPPRAEWRLAD
eukprot:m.472285 g.472285  ORF g.472285 m.472285 type:complete len:60 (-) comp32398_c0_seq1:68-247(-)